MGKRVGHGEVMNMGTSIDAYGGYTYAWGHMDIVLHGHMGWLDPGFVSYVRISHWHVKFIYEICPGTLYIYPSTKRSFVNP